MYNAPRDFVAKKKSVDSILAEAVTVNATISDTLNIVRKAVSVINAEV